jgi:hypothetical protein
MTILWEFVFICFFYNNEKVFFNLCYNVVDDSVQTNGFVFQFKMMCFQLLKRSKGESKSKTTEENKNWVTFFNSSISKVKRCVRALRWVYNDLTNESSK